MKTIDMLEQPQEPKIPQCKNASDGPISRDTDIAWLAGILDGEGFIGISGWEKKIVKRVSITNTSYELLAKASRIYRSMNLRFHWNYCKPKNRKEEFMILTVSSYGSIKKLLNVTMPYLTTKKTQAMKMLEFIAYRESIPYHSPEFAVGDRFKEFIAALQAMKKQSSELSTTTRIASQPLPEMMV